MDDNLRTVVEKRIERTMANLKNNKMAAYYVKTAQEVVPLIQELCQEGETITCGGSVTLAECGVLEHLQSGRYNYLDRYAAGADVQKIFRQAFSCDTYITGTNAVTEAGELYNIDGNGNRVAAMLFGPKSVIVVAGYNKIVANLDEARTRLRQIAAPANAVRLNTATPCKVLGACNDCHSDGRICCDYVVMSQQRTANRVKVILVGERLGY